MRVTFSQRYIGCDRLVCPMRSIVLALSLMPTFSIADDAVQCNYTREQKISLYSEHDITLVASVEGKECHDAILKIEFRRGSERVHSYSAGFKSHVSINWRDLDVINVENFVNDLFENYRFSTCEELLPKALNPLDGWNYNQLLVSDTVYDRYKNSSCKTYTYPIHYETSRVIVFTSDTVAAVAVNEYGL